MFYPQQTTEVFMRHPLLHSILLTVIGIGLVTCGSSTNDYADTADDAAAQDGAPQDEAALMRQAAIEAGIPTSDVEIPVISARTYTTGHIQVNVSGHFDIDASPELNTQASISDGEYTWIQYGDSGSEAPNATVTIGQGDIGISVGVGRYVATGTSTDCSMTTDVTATRVSGHFMCPKITGYNQADGSMGDVTIEIDFDASS
jgi:hypothetical protein